MCLSTKELGIPVLIIARHTMEKVRVRAKRTLLQKVIVSSMSSPYSTKHELGENNVQVAGLDIHNPVFVISALLILVFVIGTLIAPAEAKVILDGAKNWTINNFDWLFMSASNWFVIFCLAILVLPVGRIRLGGSDAKPEFNRMSWFAMLFSAGMGIGLMFWAVAEPIGYYTDWWGTPLNVVPNDPAAADMAMAATIKGCH